MNFTQQNSLTLAPGFGGNFFSSVSNSLTFPRFSPGVFQVSRHPKLSYKCLPTLLVFIFADFAVFEVVRENLYPRKLLFRKILSFLGNFEDQS